MSKVTATPITYSAKQSFNGKSYDVLQNGTPIAFLPYEWQAQEAVKMLQQGKTWVNILGLYNARFYSTA